MDHMGWLAADNWRLKNRPSAAIHRLEVEPRDGVMDVWSGNVSAGPQGADGRGLGHPGDSRVFGLHRDTVRKMLAYSVPPGYRRQALPKRPKLEPFTGVIDHTDKRIFERLRDEYGFDGRYTIVEDYVRERRRQSREMFVPLSHPPGHAQCDFGEARVVIGGVERKAHYFVLDLPHSDGRFVKAYPAETTEAFCDSHISAFAFLGGVPQSILYDNTMLAAAMTLGDGRRKRTRSFSELQSHYLDDRSSRPWPNFPAHSTRFSIRTRFSSAIDSWARYSSSLSLRVSSRSVMNLR